MKLGRLDLLLLLGRAFKTGGENFLRITPSDSCYSCSLLRLQCTLKKVFWFTRFMEI